jgi:hypothetical protein
MDGGMSQREAAVLMDAMGKRHERGTGGEAGSRAGASAGGLGLFRTLARRSLSEIHVLQDSRSRNSAGTEFIFKKKK